MDMMKAGRTSVYIERESLLITIEDIRRRNISK